MPRPNDYPRWRYITMQASMWGVLLCTVGIAALASNYKRGATLVTLGDPQLIDSISVRLPKGWKISDDGSDGFRAVEREDPLHRRVLTVRERDPEQMTMLERFVEGATTPAPPKRGAKNSIIKVGPFAGTLKVSREVVADGGPVDISQLRLTAIATLPNTHVVSIAVVCYDIDGRNEAMSMELLKLVAESVEYVPAKEMSKEEK